MYHAYMCINVAAGFGSSINTITLPKNVFDLHNIPVMNKYPLLLVYLYEAVSYRLKIFRRSFDHWKLLA